MGISCLRANRRVGRYSVSVLIPKQLEIGPCSSVAASRLVLLDVKGKIPPNELLQFLEEEVEPRLHSWLKKKRGGKRE
jgi:hypothetical protein